MASFQLNTFLWTCSLSLAYSAAEICKQSAASSSALIMSLMTMPHGPSPACERHLLEAHTNQGAGILCACLPFSSDRQNQVPSFIFLVGEAV